ncbi:acyl-CoA dehydrogenase family protein [Gordonia sp. NPDC003376]
MTVATRIVGDRTAVLAEIAAESAARERAAQDPAEQVELLRSAGLTALTLDTEHGGGGADPVELLDFVIDLARADPITAHILRAHFWFVEQIRRLPDGPVRDRWSAEIAAGRIFGNASSERTGTAGSFELSTRLTPIGSGWVLTGEKFYSTGTSFSDYVAAQAIIDDGSNRIARVIVPVDRPGVTVIDDWDGIGQHRTGTGSTTFTDVAVSDDEILAILDPASELPIANDAPLLQLFLQALITGILFSVADDAAGLLRSRTRSFAHAPDPSPRHDPILLATVGEIDAAAHVARAAVLAAGADIEAATVAARRGEIDPGLFDRAALAAARVKVHVDRVALPAASSLFEAGGASSASRARNLDRHWRNIRTITLHNPTSYKAVAVGDLLVNGNPLPRNGYF